MRYHYIQLLCILLVFENLSFAQEATDDAAEFYQIIAEGKTHGEVRNFFMNTLNEGELNDYYTNATGIAVQYETKSFYGIAVGAHFRSVFKSFGDPLSKEEESLGRSAKWEYELYDLLNKNEDKHLYKLEELYLKYQFGNSYMSLGRIDTEYTPLINNSDGRMSPFAHQGAWIHYQINRMSTLDIGFVNKVSPRSTSEWFSLDDAIGLFNTGFQTTGENLDYQGFTDSKGLGVLKYAYTNSKFNFEFYDVYIHHVLNTVWLEADYTWNQWNFGSQYVYQQASAFQEELPSANQYIFTNENGQVLSTQLTWMPQSWKFSLAYSRLFNTGRFLFPKGLGRDRFYTSIPRSRMEGLGNTNALVFKTQKSFPKAGVDVLLEAQSIYDLHPDEFRFNKYNKDESLQLNANITWNAKELLKGLKFEGLFVARYNQNVTSNEAIFNRSHFIQLNFMTYYRF
jgi:hypothetical protein